MVAGVAMAGMNVLILGCGVVGTAAGEALAALGHCPLGVRRRPLAHGRAGFTVISGDASNPALFTALAGAMPRIDAVLLTATPGVRRGRDHGLGTAAALVGRFLPGARLVYSGSTAVYADAGGAAVDERAALRHDDPACAALIAIEQAVMAQPGALVLRVPALVGPSRDHARERLREAARLGQPLTISGDLARPFSYLHEQDLAELCVLAVTGGLGAGVLNAASPQRLTVGGYYQILARSLGLEVALAGDGSAQPSRWIEAAALHALVGARRWRGPAEGCGLRRPR
jgi:nucleoside-diphosphate-sugar epimerase